MKAEWKEANSNDINADDIRQAEKEKSEALNRDKNNLSFSDYAYCFNCAAFSKKEEKNAAGITFPANYCGQRGEVTKATSTCSYFLPTKENAKNLQSINEYENENKKEKTAAAKKEKENKENEDNELIYSSCVIDEEKKIIAEQVINDKWESKYCIYNANTGEISYAPTYIMNGKIYAVNEGEELQKGAIWLPSTAEEYESDLELDERIRCFIHKWLEIPPDIELFGVWNIKRSWVYEQFHTLNYLRALGDTGQGKTRFLDVFGILHYKPIMTSGATTSAPIFRIIDKWRGSMIIDEADFEKSDETAVIIKIINQGYEQGKFIMRCDALNTDIVKFFNPYCPKILATRKTFADKAVEGRCITTIMRGMSRREIKRNLDESFYSEAAQLRNMLLMWRFKKYFGLQPNVQFDIKQIGDLEPRLEQIVTSFISLFIDNPEQLERFKSFMLAQQEQIINERQESFDGQILMSLHDLLEKGEIDISISDIINYGIEMGTMELDWRGKPPSIKSVSAHLRAMGFNLNSRFINKKTKRCLILNLEMINTSFLHYGVKPINYAITLITNSMESGGISVITPENSDYAITHIEKLQKNDKIDNYAENIGNKFIFAEMGGSAAVRMQRNMRNCVIESVVENEENKLISPFEAKVDLVENAQFGVKILRELIISLGSGNEGVGVEYGVFAHILAERGVAESEIKLALDNLLKSGEIFENKPGRYKAL